VVNPVERSADERCGGSNTRFENYGICPRAVSDQVAEPVEASEGTLDVQVNRLEGVHRIGQHGQDNDDTSLRNMAGHAAEIDM